MQERKRAPDTLQGAVAVSSMPAETKADLNTPRPWLWPAISTGSAVVAALAMFIALKSDTAPVATVSAAASPATPIVNEVAKALPVVPQAPAVEATAETAAEEIEEVVEIIPTSEEQIVALIRDCVHQSQLRRGVNLGISIRYDESGVAQRTFTGKLSFTAAQAGCIKEGLSAVTANEDQRKRLMSYDIYLSAGAERVRARRARD
jgi:hypothetical protein